MVVIGQMGLLQIVAVRRPYVERKEAGRQSGLAQIVEAQSVVKKPVVGQ